MTGDCIHGMPGGQCSICVPPSLPKPERRGPGAPRHTPEQRAGALSRKKALDHARYLRRKKANPPKPPREPRLCPCGARHLAKGLCRKCYDKSRERDGEVWASRARAWYRAHREECLAAAKARQKARYAAKGDELRAKQREYWHRRGKYLMEARRTASASCQHPEADAVSCCKGEHE